MLRFEHLNLSCKNLDASQEFYQKLFPDWYVRAEGVYEGRRWMHFGNNQFYLALNHTPEAIRNHSIYENIGINHVGIVITNGDLMLEKFQAEKIDYYTYSSPETKHRIYVTDPDDNEIELVEYQPDYVLK
ncbi:VOC family protein [Calothrix sp. 336/3]|uniref:VOC family protein n=1 Tax=Calothrix sp. 336/3 TaxID=1337936 RepID=UPI000AEAFD78